MECAGNRVVSTPNLDRLAAEGVMFTQASCNSPLCVPSRMSMLTGRHPHQTGAFANSDHLASDIPTFVHALGIGGYETVLCGRMHFVGPDQRHGYQRRLAGDITPTYLGGPGTRYGELKGTASQGLKSIRLAGQGSSPVLDYDEEVTRAFEQFAADRGRSPETDQPLFATIGYYGPHAPYIAPAELYEQALRAMEQEGDRPVPPDAHPRHPWVDQWFKKLDMDQVGEEDRKIARAGYIALVNRLDQLVGRVVEAASRLPGDTWIVYVSDHGEMAGDRGMFWKRSFYEGALRVPMVWHPLAKNGFTGGIRRGTRIEAPVSLVDLAPTLTSLGESPELPYGDGRDLSPLLFSGGAELADWDYDAPVYSELLISQDPPARMVRMGKYKLIYYHQLPPLQLFDLSSDPLESNNLAGNPDYREVVERLSRMLFENWNAEELMQGRRRRSADQKFLAQWGKEVGFPETETWNSEKRS